jgi:hypothetical protein
VVCAVGQLGAELAARPHSLLPYPRFHLFKAQVPSWQPTAVSTLAGVYDGNRNLKNPPKKPKSHLQTESRDKLKKNKKKKNTTNTTWRLGRKWTEIRVRLGLGLGVVWGHRSSWCFEFRPIFSFKGGDFVIRGGEFRSSPTATCWRPGRLAACSPRTRTSSSSRTATALVWSTATKQKEITPKEYKKEKARKSYTHFPSQSAGNSPLQLRATSLFHTNRRTKRKHVLSATNTPRDPPAGRVPAKLRAAMYNLAIFLVGTAIVWFSLSLCLVRMAPLRRRRGQRGMERQAGKTVEAGISTPARYSASDPDAPRATRPDTPRWRVLHSTPNFGERPNSLALYAQTSGPSLYDSLPSPPRSRPDRPLSVSRTQGKGTTGDEVVSATLSSVQK